MHNDKPKNNLNGFSMFELLVTMGILIILSIIVFPIATQQAQKAKLRSYASQLTDDIYFQQQNSYLKKEARGIELRSDGYTLFIGESLVASIENDPRSFPRNITLQSINLTLGNQILFPEGEFKPSSYGNFVISDGFYSIQIYINVEGLIDYEDL
ncbi:TPA: hypothetical protein DEP90_01760 [Patescibacteria group bacterium]|nr:hypothetical protein [Patescibacteria group bacterium]